MRDRHQIKTLSDTDLLLAYRSEGDKLCLAELFERYVHFVFCVCMKYLQNTDSSHDASMQIFLKLIEDLKTNDVKQFKPWLHTVAKNYCLMQLRSVKETVDFDQIEKKESLGFMKFASDLHLDHSEKEIQLKSLEKAILNLDEQQRTCVDLFFIQEKSYKEVSQLTGYSMNEVKSYIQNGKRNLKQMLIKSNDFNLLVFFLLLEILF